MVKQSECIAFPFSYTGLCLMGEWTKKTSQGCVERNYHAKWQINKFKVPPLHKETQFRGALFHGLAEAYLEVCCQQIKSQKRYCSNSQIMRGSTQRALWPWKKHTKLNQCGQLISSVWTATHCRIVLAPCSHWAYSGCKATQRPRI